MSKPWVPRNYQELALEFALSRQYAGLMLDPGLGKTSTYLAQIDVLRTRGDVHRTLVTAPLRVAKTVWPVEAQKWSDFNHLRVADLTERTDSQREELLSDPKNVVCVINPESLYKVVNPEKIMGRGLKAQFVDNIWGFDHFISDESTRFADASTQRFKMLKPTLGNYNYRNIATGTPTPNGYHQLFGQCYLLDQGKALGEYVTHFRQMYMHPDPYIPHVYKMNPGAGDRILERVAHMLLRMKAKDHLDMPELVTNEILVKMPSAVQKKYDDFERDFLIQIANKQIPAFNKASLGVKCRQVANGFIYDPDTREAHHFHDEKLNALEQLIEEMQGRPLLVMYEFIADGQRISERFPGAVNVTGARDVERLVRDFNAGRIPVLIGHPRSAGHGLNLQESCHDICWYGVTWDLELWLQAIARVWRQGQPSSVVTNHIILADNTTDSGVVEGLGKKEATQDTVDNALIEYAKRKLAVT